MRIPTTISPDTSQPASPSSPGRKALLTLLPWLTALGVLIQLLSLRLGLLDAFFFDSAHANVQGIDYFALPKAFLNLAAGRSMYDSFSPPAFGPHSTWYVVHPALVVVLGSWLSRFEPMTSYGIYTLLSLAMMATCAWVLSRQTADPLVRRLIGLLILTAFPTYILLYVGNIQALVVLALGLLFSGVLALTYADNATPNTKYGEPLVLAGLLLSLLTKPVVLLMLPVLLLVKPTRRAALRALAVYIVVSLVFELIPALNPQAIGLSRVLWYAAHPAVIRDTMNIYTNQQLITEPMRDNAAHWFNLIAQTGAARLIHIDVFSLPVFLDTLTGTATPTWIYQLPTLALLLLSVGVARVKNTRLQLEALLLLLLAASLAFFLSYPTAWEYQYTAVLPVAAVLLLLRDRAVFYERLRPWLFALAASLWLPSLYVFTEGHPVTAGVLTLIHLDRVVPVTLLFLAIVVGLATLLFRSPPAFGVANKQLPEHPAALGDFTPLFSDF